MRFRRAQSTAEKPLHNYSRAAEPAHARAHPSLRNPGDDVEDVRQGARRQRISACPGRGSMKTVNHPRKRNKKVAVKLLLPVLTVLRLDLCSPTHHWPSS